MSSMRYSMTKSCIFCKVFRNIKRLHLILEKKLLLHPHQFVTTNLELLMPESDIRILRSYTSLLLIIASQFLILHLFYKYASETTLHWYVVYLVSTTCVANKTPIKDNLRQILRKKFLQTFSTVGLLWSCRNDFNCWLNLWFHFLV